MLSEAAQDLDIPRVSTTTPGSSSPMQADNPSCIHSLTRVAMEREEGNDSVSRCSTVDESWTGLEMISPPSSRDGGFDKSEDRRLALETHNVKTRSGKPSNKATKKRKKSANSSVATSQRSQESPQEREQNSKKIRMVNFDLLSDTVFGEDCLYRMISINEIDSLVGLATCLCQRTTTTTASTTTITNPLLVLPNFPPRHSHLKYLCSLCGTLPPSLSEIEWREYEYQVSNEGPEVLDPINSDTEVDSWQEWDHSQNDENYQALKGLKLNDVFQVTLPVRHKGSVAKTIGNWFKTMDSSAKVAVGMLVEDVVTATLLPLARDHVARCRELDSEKAFAEWTLPAVEAILALSNDASS